MCPYPQMTRKKEHMPMELYRKIIDDAVECRIKYVDLNVYNEPLPNDRLPEVIRYAKIKGLPEGFTSNGTVATSNEMAEILETGIDEIIISFDGSSKDTYEKIRVGARFEVTQANILHTIREPNRLGLDKPLKRVTCVMQEIQEDNKHDVEKYEASWQGVADEVPICREGECFGIYDVAAFWWRRQLVAMLHMLRLTGRPGEQN
jgi:MoaA/NifB/PqqE/SkfB family radical SAM enzyme